MTSIRILKCSVLATYSEDNSKSAFATPDQDIRNNGVDFNVRNDTFITHVIHFPVSKKPSFIAIRVEEVDNACIHAYIDIHIQIQTPAEESWHGGTGGLMAILLKFFPNLSNLSDLSEYFQHTSPILKHDSKRFRNWFILLLML